MTLRFFRWSPTLCLIVVLISPFLLKATPPGWWSDRGVIDPTQTPNDYAAVNQGQLKFITQQAAAELAAHLPGGINVPAGADLQTLLNTLANPSASTNDYAAVNLGQLKAVAKPFYELLMGVGYTNVYPWAGHEASTNDYAAANVGQVKNLFSFDLTAVTAANDLDGDGIPDWWEKYFFPATYGTSSFSPNALAARGGGLTILQAFQQGLNPNDFYNGQTPSLNVVSGNNQTAVPGSFVPAPLIVQVSDAGGNPIQGAPVVFSVGTGGGQLQLSSSASPKTTVNIQSDANGQAKVFFQAPSTTSTTCTVTATTVADGNPIQAPAFTEKSSDGTGTTNPAPTDPDNPTDPQPVPTQAYAGIDASGDAVSTNVNLVTLDDHNVLSFEADDRSGNGPFYTYVWQNGVLGAPQTTPGVIDTAFSPIATPEPTPLIPQYVLPTGELMGRCGDDLLPDIVFGYGLFFSTGGSVTPSYLPAFAGYEEFAGITVGGLTSVANNGTMAGTAIFFDHVVFSFICVSGTYLAFDANASSSDYALPPGGSNWTVVTDPLVFNAIAAVNSSGQAVGDKYVDPALGNFSVVYWDGAKMTAVGPGRSAGLNEQGQAIARGLGNAPGQAEGYLWENGTTTVLANHVPAGLQGQIAQIEPFAISNQTAPGTDATIYLLANAQVNGAAATIVCTRDNDGNWSFAQIQQPDGTTISQYVSINSSGVIAFIGTISDADNDSSSNDTLSIGNSTAMRRVTKEDQGASAPSPSPTPTLKAGTLNPITVSIAANSSESGWNTDVDKFYGNGIFIATVYTQLIQGHTYLITIEQDIQATLKKTYTDDSYATFETNLIQGNSNGFVADSVPPNVKDAFTSLDQSNAVGLVFHDIPGISVFPEERGFIKTVNYSGVATTYIKLIKDGQEQKPATKVTWSFTMSLGFSSQNAKSTAPPKAGIPQVKSTPAGEACVTDDPKHQNYQTADCTPNNPDTEVSPRTPGFYEYVNNPKNWHGFPAGNNKANTIYPPSVP